MRVEGSITRSNAQVSTCIDSGKLYAGAIVLKYLLPPLILYKMYACMMQCTEFRHKLCFIRTYVHARELCV